MQQGRNVMQARTSRNMPIPGIIQEASHHRVSLMPMGRASSSSSSVPSSRLPEIRWYVVLPAEQQVGGEGDRGSCA
jgi:hypothetical protein